MRNTIYPAGARVPITSYTCTHPDLPGYNDDDHCTGNMSTRFRTCEAEEGASHVRSIPIVGLYGWRGNTNPFMVLDIPQGWCVGSVEMTFQLLSDSIIPTPVFHSTVQNTSPATLTRQHSQFSQLLVQRVADRLY